MELATARAEGGCSDCGARPQGRAHSAKWLSLAAEDDEPSEPIGAGLHRSWLAWASTARAAWILAMLVSAVWAAHHVAFPAPPATLPATLLVPPAILPSVMRLPLPAWPPPLEAPPPPGARPPPQRSQEPGVPPPCLDTEQPCACARRGKCNFSFCQHKCPRSCGVCHAPPYLPPQPPPPPWFEAGWVCSSNSSMAGMVGAAVQGNATHEAEGDREADDALADDSTRPVIGGPLINMDFSMGRHDWQRILMHLVIMPASAPVTHGHATDEEDGELPMAGRCHWWRRYLQYVYGEPFNDESLDLPLPSPSDLDVLYHWPATQIAAQRAPPQAARVGDRVGDGVGDRVSGGVGDRVSGGVGRDQSRPATSPATSSAENSAMLAVATTQEVAAATTGPQLAPEPLQPPRCPLSSPTTGYLEPYLGRVVHAPREAVSIPSACTISNARAHHVCMHVCSSRAQHEPSMAPPPHHTASHDKLRTLLTCVYMFELSYPACAAGVARQACSVHACRGWQLGRGHALWRRLE